jgi:hypothetical protein
MESGQDAEAGLSQTGVFWGVEVCVGLPPNPPKGGQIKRGESGNKDCEGSQKEE